MKKGFTLVELLAVLVILSIIVVVSVPQLLSMINSSKQNTKVRVIKLIESAARVYASDHKLGESTPILISTLCDENYLDCPITDPTNDQEITGYLFSSVNKSASGSIIYNYYSGTPTYLSDTILATVGGKDVAVNKYAGNGLYKNGSKYIYRGGITKTNANGLATPDYATDTDSGSDVNNYVQVPWETYSVGETCTSSTNNCYRIMSINDDGSMNIIRDKVDGNQVFDNVHNTDASTYYSDSGTNYGYNDLLANTPSSGHPEESRATSLMYTALYGTTGYYNSKIKLYYNMLIEMSVCLNKMNGYINMNDTTHPTYVSDTCNITGKTNTTTVNSLKDVYIRLPYIEEYLNGSIESTCNTDHQYQCRNKNYLFNKQNYFTLNGYYSSSWLLNAAFANGSTGTSYAYSSVGIRPVVTLKSTAIISGGTGTASSPYVLMG